MAWPTEGKEAALTAHRSSETMTMMGRATLTFRVAGSLTRTSIDLARHAEELGADCIMSPAPLMIYDGGAGIELSVEQMRRPGRSPASPT